MSYGLLYGMGGRTLGEKLNMTEHQAIAYVKAFKAKFVGYVPSLIYFLFVHS